MAIVYNGTTFSGANSAQNVNYNGTNMCTVLIGATPVFSRGRWNSYTNGSDNRFCACVYRIDSDGEIYVCWWVNPSKSFVLCHPDFEFNSDVTLSMCLARKVFSYDLAGYIGRSKIVVEGTSGECSNCVFVCTLSSSQWNPQVGCSKVYVYNSPSSTCSDMASYRTCCSGTFRFYWPGDTAVGRCWYYGRGGYRACGDSYASYCIACLCFNDDSRNGVLINCSVGYDRWTCICA